jgi:hypothetical protein
LFSEAADYVHPELNREVTAIGGHYVPVKEARLPVDGREVLYVAGYAVIDTSCCGTGGCGYALVPGFILDWKYRRNEGGLSVSRTEPIRDPEVQDRVRRLIQEREMVNQVNFQ